MPTTLKTESVIKAIYEMNGNLTAVARKFQTTRMRMYRFMEKHPSVKDALDESRERMLDNAESVLYRKVLSGEDTTALIFFLKTQGAKRGYTERIDHQDSSGSKAILELAGAIRKGWSEKADSDGENDIISEV